MDGHLLKLGSGEIDAFILQALIRKLVEKGVLSTDDVRSLLFEAAERLTPMGSPLTPEAARAVVASDLLPAFLDPAGAATEPAESGRGLATDDDAVRPV